MSSYSRPETAGDGRNSAPALATHAYAQIAQESWAPQAATVTAAQAPENSFTNRQPRNCIFPETTSGTNTSQNFLPDSNQLMLEASVALNHAGLSALQGGDMFGAMNDIYLSGQLSNQVLSDWPAGQAGNTSQPFAPGSPYLPPFSIGTADGAGGAPTGNPFDPIYNPAYPMPADYGATAGATAAPGSGLNFGGVAGGLVGDSLALPTVAAGGLLEGAGSFVENTGNGIMNTGVDMLGNPATTMIGIPVATVGAAADAAGWAVDQVGQGAVAVGDAVVNGVKDIGNDIGNAVSSAFSWL